VQQKQTAIRAASRVRDKPCGQQVRTVAPTALTASLSATVGCLSVCQSTRHTNQNAGYPPLPNPILFKRYSLHMYVPKVHHSQHKTQPLGSIVRKCNTILRVAFSSQVFRTFTFFLVSPSNETP